MQYTQQRVDIIEIITYNMCNRFLSVDDMCEGSTLKKARLKIKCEGSTLKKAQ